MVLFQCFFELSFHIVTCFAWREYLDAGTIGHEDAVEFVVDAYVYFEDAGAVLAVLVYLLL